jgi:hypothetical protein
MVKTIIPAYVMRPLRIPSTSDWTGLRSSCKFSRVKTCDVTRLRTSTRPMQSSAGATYEMMEAAGRTGAKPDEYEFVVQPRLAGHGLTLFAGPSKVLSKLARRFSNHERITIA